MYTFQKQPSEVLDYDIVMDDWFSAIPGDDIQSVVLSVSSLMEETPTLVLGPAPHPTHILMGATPTKFKVWVGAGTEYVDYIITCVVTTEQDRRKEVEFKVKVRNT